VIDYLKDIDEFENTIIIFTSDNGPNPWTSEEYPGNSGTEWFAQFDNDIENIGRPGSFVGYGIGWASAGAGPLDYFKLTVGEGGIRTPLIITGPGVQGARQVDSFAYVTDVMPTILELAEVEHPESYRGRPVERMRGRSLASVTSGAEEDTYAKDALIGGEMINGKWMRQGNYKAVSVAAPFGPGEWRLYNVADDPGETRNLANEQPELLKRLQAAWERYSEDVGVIPGKD
jgi:arylsulfatase